MHVNISELVKFNKLTVTMKTTLSLLQKAIKGLELMSNELEAMFSSFRNNKVPKIWADVGYSSLKPLASWVLDTIDRVEFMRTWLREGAPTCFPLYLFFFPQGFLTGALQNHARKHRQPINRLDFRYEVLEGDGDDDRSNDHEDILEPPEDGVIVYGIWMQGARWSAEGYLEESRKGIMFDCLPPVHLVPELAHVQAQGTYMLPCYKTTTRAGALSTTGTSTNFVFAVELPMSNSDRSQFWTLNGAAGILNLNN